MGNSINLKNWSHRLLKSKLEGFIMLEAIITLGLVSFFTVSFLQIISSMRNQYAEYVTNQKAENLVKYLSLYVSRFGALPYPAKLGSASTNGLEYRHNNLPTEEDWKQSPQEYTRGIVPYRTLGIAESEVKDGYGSYFTYIINPSLGKRSNVLSIAPNDPRCQIDTSFDWERMREKQNPHQDLSIIESSSIHAGYHLNPFELEKQARYSSIHSVRAYDAEWHPTSKQDNRAKSGITPYPHSVLTWDITSYCPETIISGFERISGDPINLESSYYIVPNHNTSRAIHHGDEPGDSDLTRRRNWMNRLAFFDVVHMAGLMEVESKILQCRFTREAFLVKDCIAFALISHGKSRLGSWKKDGGVCPVPDSACLEKKKNSNTSPEVNKFYISSESAEFDDKVVWVSRFNLGMHGNFYFGPFQIHMLRFTNIAEYNRHVNNGNNPGSSKHAAIQHGLFRPE